MKNCFVIFLTLTLIACGPSQDEKESVAAVTCSIMGATRNMDAADRIREMNAAREKIGGEPYLGGDERIKTSFSIGGCEYLVLSDELFEEHVFKLADLNATRETERIERERISCVTDLECRGLMKKDEIFNLARKQIKERTERVAAAKEANRK